MKKILEGQEGMTGLETAIILIAFVTVAAVFGYAVLSAGLFASEREKETIYAGLQQARANMEVVGSIIAYGDNATNSPTKVAKILFTCRNAIAGTPIDMTPNRGGRENRCIISLTTTTAYYNNVKWTAQFVGNHDNDQLLEAGEQLEITLDMADLGAGFGDPGIGPNAVFNIQVKPTQGSTMTIQRTLPAAIDPVMDLDLMTGSGSNGTGGGSGGGGTQLGISVSQLTLGFGSVLVGVTSTAQAVTVSNTGAANLVVGAITLGGTNTNQFAIASDTASSQTIAPGASGTVNVTFNPTSTGVKSAALSIPSNDPTNTLVTVALSGTGGTPPGGGLELVPGEFMTADILNGCVTKFTVSVELVAGGNPIDMIDSGAIDFDITTPAEGSANNLPWVSNKVVGDGDNMLEPSEWYDVRVDLSGFPALHSDDTFTLNATPAGGSTYPFQIKLFHFPSNFTGTVSFNNNYGL